MVGWDSAGPPGALAPVAPDRRAQVEGKRADQFGVSSKRFRQPARRLWRSLGPALLVFVVGAGVAGATATLLARAEHSAADAALTALTRDTATEVGAEALRYVEALQDLAAEIAEQDEITPASLTTVTSWVRHKRLPGTGAVLFTAASGAIQYENVINPPAGGTADHRTGADRTAASGPQAAVAMATARDTGQVTASTTLNPTGPVALILVGPVHAGPLAQPAGSFRGWVLMTVRSGQFLTDAMVHATRGIAHVTLAEATDLANPVAQIRATDTAGTPGTATAHGSELTRRVDLTVADRTWRLTVTAPQPLINGATAYSDEAALAGGLVIAVLLSWVFWLATTARQRATTQVEQATAALRADIARRKSIEAQLRDRESELAGFVAVAAHDLRTPLTNVAAYADLLAEIAAEDLDATCLGFVQRIGSGVRRMTKLIDDLLDFTTANNARLRTAPVNLRVLVSEVIAEHTTHLGQTRPNIDVGTLPVLHGDPETLRRLLDNLIGNAIKYVRHGDTAKITIGASHVADGWRIEIADRGIGIPSDQQVAVFTAFHRDRAAEGYPGTGLGLAICKRIVDRHGGHIGVEENPGGGSRFWFTLPEPAPADRRATAATGGHAPEATITAS